MTNMEWHVNNGSKLMRPHYMGSVRSHTCTTSVAYHSFFFFFRKTACQKYFFKNFSQKKLALWISKIRIWIWSEKSTLRVDFMDSWSRFGFSQKNTPSASSSGPSQLGKTTGVQIYFLKGTWGDNSNKGCFGRKTN